MERLTIPDKPIDGGMRRAIIDARAVRAEAMTIYWALKKYEDTGLTPEQIREIDRLYAEQSRELMAYKKGWEKMLMSWLPDRRPADIDNCETINEIAQETYNRGWNACLDAIRGEYGEAQEFPKN